MWSSMVTVGRIVRPHGHRGNVVVQPESDFASDRFQPGAELYWNTDGEAAKVVVTSSREFRGRWVVAFEGVDSMDAAERLRDHELRVPADALKQLGAGAFYVHDLKDCLVVTDNGAEVGRVTGVQFGSGAPVLMIGEPDGGEVLVPMVDEICTSIDPAAKRIVIRPLEGLLELNRVRRR